MYLSRSLISHSILAALFMSASVISLSGQANAAGCPAPDGDGYMIVYGGTTVDELCEIASGSLLIVNNHATIDVGLDSQAIGLLGTGTHEAQAIFSGSNSSVIGYTHIKENESFTDRSLISGLMESNTHTLWIEGNAYEFDISQTAQILGHGNDATILIDTTGRIEYFRSYGTIESGVTGTAVKLTGGAYYDLFQNLGTISGGTNGLDVNINSDGVGQIQNFGVIEQKDKTQGNALTAINTHSSGLTVFNFGLIDGHVELGSTALYLAGKGAGNEVTGEMRITGEIRGTNESYIYIGHSEETDFTLEDSVTVKQIALFEGSKMDFEHTFMNVDQYYTSGEVDLGLKTIELTGDYDQEDGLLRVGAKNLSQYGRLVVGGTATFSNNATLYVDVAAGAINFSKKGELQNVISAGTLNVYDLSIDTNSVLYDFDYLIDGNNLHITFGLDDPDTGIQKRANAAGQGAAHALDDIMQNNPGGHFDDVINAFGNLTTDQQVTDAVTQLLPPIGANTTQATLNVLHNAGQIILSRQDDKQDEGLSSGDATFMGGKAWLKPFGSWAKQKSTQGYTGYESNGYGMMAGVDGQMSDNASVGLALAYSDNTIKGLDAARTQKVDVKSYLATLYGSYALNANTEINARLGGGFGKNEGRSIIAFGGANTVAKSDYDSLFLDASLGVSQAYKLSPATTLTPSVRVDYLYVHNDAYTQTGAGGFNQRIQSQTTDQLLPTLAAKLQHKLSPASGLSVNLGVGYDVLNDRNQVTSQFVGGGPAFSTQGGKTSPWVTNAGLGFTYKPSTSWDVTARYDAQMRGSDYHDQSVSLKIRAPF